MLKKIVASLVSFVVIQSSALAFHGQYSPMAPRQISQQVAKQDYSYGLSVLPGNGIDSIEWVNRNVGFNINYYVIDKYMLRPLAHGYAHFPEPVKDGVGNFFSNISELNNTLNNLLLWEVADSGTSLSRFTINSTLGLFGLFDVATHFGIEKKAMSMDTVLGRAGVDQGAYLVLAGPSTERSLHADAIDNWPYMLAPGWVSLVCYLVETIDGRARLIPQEKLIDEAIDPYAQMRQVYFMYKQGLVDPEVAMQDTKDENVEEFLNEIDE